MERRRFGKYHTPHRPQIVWVIADNYNILDNFLQEWNNIHILFVFFTI
ncbi:MAG: hypothetical protein MjAS7_0077 [Metallosphaera javensis (ex Sakai et al. 2022)]|nr:MAG: hypothetical protein MjAS7_0077 [Metallosphaera javensis (ex Sakai et al. 2022)]